MTLARIQVRRDTTTGWAAANPILASGEPGFDTTLKQLRIGDGATPWLGLPAATPDGATIAQILATAEAIEGAVAPTDAAMAAAITTPGTATKSALSATIAAAIAPIAALDGLKVEPRLNAGQVAPFLASPMPTYTFGRRWGLSAMTPSAGGSGYVVGDTITLAGGEFEVPAIVTVSTVSGGAVTAVSLRRAGVYTASPSGTFTQASTSGTGTGFTGSGTWSGVPSALTSTDITGIGANDASFRFTGNGPGNIGSSGGYGNAVGNGTHSTFEWETDRAYLELRMLGGNMRFMLYIDDKRISESDLLTDASGGAHVLRLTHATSAMRRYRLIGANNYFQGVRYSTAAGGTHRAPTFTRPLWWWIGDSYTFGTGTTEATASVAGVAGLELGVDVLPDGVGGAGWQASTAGSALDRVNAKLAALTRAPSVVVWDLGYNNRATSTSTVTAAMQVAITRVKELYPNALQIGIGPATPVGETPQLATLKAAMAAKFAEHDIPMIDVSTWVTSANSGLYTATDLEHPNSLGHRYLGARRAAAIRPHLVQ